MLDEELVGGSGSGDGPRRGDVVGGDRVAHDDQDSGPENVLEGRWLQGQVLEEGQEVFRELPMEFAVEAQKLLGISLEGSVG